MSIQFLRRGTVSNSSVPSTPSVYKPVGTQHVWWATDLMGTYADGVQVTTWPDSEGSLDLTGQIGGFTDNSLDYSAINSRAAVKAPIDLSAPFTADISGLTYTDGSIFVVGSMTGDAFYVGIAVTLSNSGGAFLSFNLTYNNTVSSWNCGGVYAGTSGNYVYWLGNNVADADKSAVFEISQSPLVMRVNGSTLTLTEIAAQEMTLSDVNGIWINDFDTLEFRTNSTDGDVPRVAKMGLALLTNADPTDRADFKTWADTYYGL